MEMELLKLKGRDYWLLVLGFRLSSSILTHSARQLATDWRAAQPRGGRLDQLTTTRDRHGVVTCSLLCRATSSVQIRHRFTFQIQILLAS